MDKSHFTNLTLSIYRITDLFPEKEPLRFLVRKKADDILRDLTLVDYYSKDFSFNNKQALMGPLERVLKNVVVLGVYFNISEKQNWVKPENFLVLRAEYGAIEQEVKRLRLEAGSRMPAEPACREARMAVRPVVNSNAELRKAKPVINNPAILTDLKDRQRKILQILKTKGVAQVQDLNRALPEVTKRTLRRDMDFLFKRGLVARLGDKIKTEYRLKV